MTLTLLKPKRELKSPNCYGPRPIGARVGVMLHFDDSSSDASAIAWFTDPECHVSYNRLYLDDGAVVQITPTMECAAWHAGVCIDATANRHYYGLAAATDTRTPATRAQFESIVHDCVALFALNGWRADEVDRRIVGHEDQATPKGRKIDPTGLHADRPILSTVDVRRAVRADLLAGRAA